MDIVDKFSKNVVKILKTPIELTQAIANLSAQNTHGQHDERISLYITALEKYKNTHKFAGRNERLRSSGTDCAAIMHFNRDTRFSITE